jgi:site-specific recombinase XerD
MRLHRVLSIVNGNHATILVTNNSERFSLKGFDEIMSAASARRACRSVVWVHGLREAAARRLAEAGPESKTRQLVESAGLSWLRG